MCVRILLGSQSALLHDAVAEHLLPVVHRLDQIGVSPRDRPGFGLVNLTRSDLVRQRDVHIEVDPRITGSLIKADDTFIGQRLRVLDPFIPVSGRLQTILVEQRFVIP